jgi:S-adenosylmethionine synthetase
MIEKVNPAHPDKVADRIAGALVDIAYTIEEFPKIAVEVLIGHGACHIIAETSVLLNPEECFPQDKHLADNQSGMIRCGDNGIFKGAPKTTEQKRISRIAHRLYNKYRSDGKYIIDGKKLIICQSNADSRLLKYEYPSAIINPLGEWTGGLNVDTGATNRKLGSDMGDSVTGGGLHGKDLSKADVSVNIYASALARMLNKPVELSCAIGDEYVNGVLYAQIVRFAENYIRKIGGFEKFAEWGLF